MSMSTNVITLDHIKKTYGNFALDIEHLEIKSGYITGIIGENGAGKSTMLKIIMDALRPDTGAVEIFGAKVDQNFVYYKQQIGFVGESSGFVDECTAAQIKNMFSPFYENWDDNLYNQYIKQFNIPSNVKLKKLSKGQNKIFNLIMVLSYHPKLIILDEPTANLDPVVRNELLQILSDLMLDETISVLYSTHITSDLEKTSDYVIYLHQGKIKLNAEREVLEENYCIVKGDNALLTDEVLGLLEHPIKTNAGFKALCSNKSRIAALLGGEAVIENATLEDMMIYTAKEVRE